VEQNNRINKFVVLGISIPVPVGNGFDWPKILSIITERNKNKIEQDYCIQEGLYFEKLIFRILFLFLTFDFHVCSYTFEMKMILNCLVLGSTSNMFPVIIADVIRFNDALVSIDEFSIDLFKMHIWKEIENILVVNLKIWIFGKLKFLNAKKTRKYLKIRKLAVLNKFLAVRS
jgi:hypothetical protein